KKKLSRSGYERSEFPDKSLYLASSEDCQVTPTAQPNLQPILFVKKAERSDIHNSSIVNRHSSFVIP
ncbi:MAG: hypothetical protein V2J65_28015, partial [Desulfobacteraceae bacterium]|nr:hypothetical protein [Desulfobacteraceae bacterium]